MVHIKKLKIIMISIILAVIALIPNNVLADGPSYDITNYDMDAYMMLYLDEDRNFSLFDFPTAMLLENFSRIEQDASMLADNHIIMCDVDISNSIYDQLTSQLYISDIDLYFPSL